MDWAPPRSPYNLIQEHLWHDPWKLFVACIFCNLTRRVDAEPYMWKFFKRYPGSNATDIKFEFPLIEGDVIQAVLFSA